MKVRIKQRPTGYISIGGGPLQAWPENGAVLDLPDQVAEDLIAADRAERVRIAKTTDTIETRPAPKQGEEVRVAKRPAAAAKRPAVVPKESGATG